RWPARDDAAGSIPMEGGMAGAAPQHDFGRLLRELRQEAGLTQAALAERAGLSVRAVQHLERALGQPQRETARRLMTALRLAGAQRAQFEAAAAPAPRVRATAPAAAAVADVPAPAEPEPAPAPPSPMPAGQ